MKLKLVDKIWFLGAAIAAVVAFHVTVNDIPHTGTPMPWSFLVLIASLAIFWFKLRASGILKLPNVISVLILVGFVTFLTFYSVNLRYQVKSKIISQSSSVVEGVVIRVSELRSRVPGGLNVGLRIVYKYSVNGKEYTEEDGVADNLENRELYSLGRRINIRYAHKNPSISEVVAKNTTTNS